MSKARPTWAKRQKELAQRERKEDKARRRETRKLERPEVDVGEGEDPDLVGIVAGPQPIPEWLE